jgi:hypothetical protein
LKTSYNLQNLITHRALCCIAVEFPFLLELLTTISCST